VDPAAGGDSSTSTVLLKSYSAGGTLPIKPLQERDEGLLTIFLRCGPGVPYERSQTVARREDSRAVIEQS
jgi:hypothetical protein